MKGQKLKKSSAKGEKTEKMTVKKRQWRVKKTEGDKKCEQN